MAETVGVAVKSMQNFVWLLQQQIHGPERLLKRFLLRKSLGDMELSSFISSTDARFKVTQLNSYFVFFLVFGHMVGAGIFVLLGRAAGSIAGPSILFSILLAAILVFLSALTYSELCSSYPMSGGAFNYASAIFGEFVAWITMSVISMSTLASGGALARNWSLQLARLCGKRSFLVEVGALDLDFVALGITLAILGAVALSTEVVTWANIVLKSILCVVIVILLAVAVPEGKPENFDPFLPYGSGGVFAGAAAVFFAFTGYDAACYMAEETREPRKNVPAGTLSAIGFVTVVYFLMAMALTGGVPYNKIDTASPFYNLLEDLDRHWAAVLVTAGGLIAIATVLMISLMVSIRQLLAVARYHLLPSWLAKIDPKWNTPLRMTLAFGILKSLLALTTSARQLADYRSGAVLLVVIVVASAFIWSRYVHPELTFTVPKLFVGFLLLSIVVLSMVFGAFYKLGTVKTFTLNLLFGAWVILSLSFSLVKEVEATQVFRVPFPNLVGSYVIMGASFFLWQLGPKVVTNLAYFVAASTVLYFIYGIHAAERHDDAVDLYIREKLVGGAVPYEDTTYKLSPEEMERLDAVVEHRRRAHEEGLLM